ncbi:hypothetical protein AXE80_08455 [Wenyingzhuangia fucanilytica]|uniref:UDP-glycosyltransferase n=1 Tax=Wenyingzhuangia fucanilytica TaxID=1790137 RepID=A0A1B1Y6A5_9FLAO|nr:hypothetical protein [Wenyingzhuangia fucanilytica]ANW96306.1 hypothetical protein AXE80_08455 [Wenyingzhuangia fucanilytica]
MVKILIISESIDIEDSSGSKVNVALIQNLKKIGYQVKVLHYTRKEIQLGSDIECISIPEIKFSLNYVLSRTQRIVQRVLKVDLSIFLEKIFGNSFTFFNDSKSISKAIKKCFNDEDIIFTLSKGASFRPHHAMLSLPNLHDKWLAYIHDPFPFHCYPRPYDFLNKGAFYKENFMKLVSLKAKYSGFPSLYLQEWMGSYFPSFLKSGIVIPHQNLEIKNSVNNCKIDYFDKKKFNMLHAGNLMKERNPEGLIKGYKLFLERNPRAKEVTKLILLGQARDHKEYIKSNINKNLYWSDGNVPFAEVNDIQNEVSVNIILEAKGHISPFLPGKFPHIINANKPVLLLGPYYSESKRLLGNDYPFITEIDDVDKISKLIEQLYFNWIENKNQQLGREELADYCGLPNLEKQMNQLFYSVTK